jgi:hypothetical protein
MKQREESKNQRTKKSNNPNFKILKVKNQKSKIKNQKSKIKNQKSKIKNQKSSNANMKQPKKYGTKESAKAKINVPRRNRTAIYCV